MPSFYGAVDLAKNELRNAVVQNLGAAPSSPNEGQIYYNSTAGTKTLYFWNGTAWVSASGATPATTVTTQAVGDAAVVGTLATFAREDHKHGREAFAAPTAETTFGTSSAAGSAATLPRSDHTHGNPTHDATAHSGLLGAVTAEPTFGSASTNGAATTISRSDHAHGNPTHVAGDHSAIPLSALAVPTASLNLNSQKIINLLDPTNPQDGATKNYVDLSVQGLDSKASCHAATTANIANLASGAPNTLDGVTLVVNDRVLVKDQTTQAQNGIYTITTLGTGANGVWARAADMNSWANVPSAYTWVESGTVNADTGWTCTADVGGTLGTTAITWVLFSSAASMIAGAGMTKTGNTIDVIAADTTMTINPDSLQVNTAVIATQAFVNTAVTGMVKKYAQALTGTASPETITHNLNTRDVDVSVINSASPYSIVTCDIAVPTVNTITVTYNPNLGSGYRVVVIG